MLSRKSKLLIMKIVSLFSVIRGYNIPIIILAQYLSALFILAPEKKQLNVILDINLFLIVLATALTIASGYIINNFYDSKKDLINRPNKSILDRLVSQKTKLNFYFILNFVVAFLAFFISWRAFIYFSVYIFLIWFYSHKVKKFVVIGNLMATLMAISPFFALLHTLYTLNFLLNHYISQLVHNVYTCAHPDFNHLLFCVFLALMLISVFILRNMLYNI
jgi:4-hydroxybenzoate polyprenyltransferase